YSIDERARLMLAVGLGVTGETVARWAAHRGESITIVEDRPGGDLYEQRAAAARELGHVIVGAPDAHTLGELVRNADIVVPSPGVPEHHPVYALASASGTSVFSEIELAGRELAARGRTLVAITGTNGKTT